jgi:flagellar motor protein MotB
MTNNRSGLKLNKRIPAFVIALGMTGLIGLATMAVSANALMNRNVVPLQGSATVVQATGTDAGMVQQLQDQVSQYQARELEYQAREQQYQAREQQYQAHEQQFNQELQQAAQQLNDANGQIQQYQSLLMALQNAGVIRIGQNGQIFISQGNNGGGENEGNGG